MPSPGDFDPARAIRGLRQAEEDEKIRLKAQEDLHRANILKLLRYADKQLEEIHTPIVSEFDITERWWTTERISDKRDERAFKKTLRAGQRIISREDGGGFFRPRTMYTVATRHKRQLARYYGSWLWLRSTTGRYRKRWGLVKLRQPRAGYARVHINGWHPRNVGYITVYLTDLVGRKIPKDQHLQIHRYFQIFASLEEAIEGTQTSNTSAVNFPVIASPEMAIEGELLNHSIERLTKHVQQTLDFVATGQPPEPEWIEPEPTTTYDY